MQQGFPRPVNPRYVHYAKAPIVGEWVVPWDELSDDLRARAGHEASEAPPPLARTRTAGRPIYRSPSPVRRTVLDPARWIASPSTTAVTWSFTDTGVFV